MAEIKTSEDLPLYELGWGCLPIDNDIFERLEDQGYKKVSDISPYLNCSYPRIPGLPPRFTPRVIEVYRDIKEFEKACGGLIDGSVMKTIEKVMQKYGL